MKYKNIADIVNKLPECIYKVHSEPFNLSTSFIDLVRRFAHLPGTIALLSGGELDSARYHILGINPIVSITANGEDIILDYKKKNFTVKCDPFEILKCLVTRYKLSPQTVPIAAGLIGYLSYDLKDVLESLPRTSIDDLQLPSLYMTIPSILIIRDRKKNQNFLYLPVMEKDNEKDIQQRLKWFNNMLTQQISVKKEYGGIDEEFYSPFTREAYMKAVEKIRNYILDGHVYQVNMAQRFQSSLNDDPFELFEKMYEENPASFFAYINAGDHQILSTSPERFIEMKDNIVETRPIKGTRPRGKTPEEDLQYKQDLLNNPKDNSELSMIVDLLRNDIGKVCQAGSVKVVEHKRLEPYQNVYHLVSIITGKLDEDKDMIDLIKATFPGGSITGCPKIRSMEIIDELEPVRRHIYTGSIGYLSFHNSMDLSIAIRTATVKNKKVYFSVGGGIVYDSIPGDEYEETLHKGQTLMKILKKEDTSLEIKRPFIWCDGLLKPIEEISVSFEDLGFLYGYGFFETLRVQKGKTLMLEDHMKRFNKAWKYFFPDTPSPDLSWDEIIRQVIEKNDLQDKIAAVKILASAKKITADYPALFVSAREYKHRLANSTRKGLCLAVYPYTRHTPLADHKTMNYLYYKLAGQWAKNQQMDEAVICNADNSVSETNTANIFCRIKDKIIFPESKHVLPGTMEAAVCKCLKKWNIQVITQSLTVDKLKKAENVFITNSLIGIVPVIKIDETSYEPDTDFCQRVNTALNLIL